MKLISQRVEALELRDKLNAVNLLTVSDDEIDDLLERNPLVFSTECSQCLASRVALVELATESTEYSAYICKPCALKTLDLFKTIEV